MKIRSGFVSNSSSTSFTCPFCKKDVFFYDHDYSNWYQIFEVLGYVRCEKGHWFHLECAPNSKQVKRVIETSGNALVPKRFCPVCKVLSEEYHED